MPPIVVFTQAVREVVNSNDRGSLPKKVVHPYSRVLPLRRSADVSLHSLKCLAVYFLRFHRTFAGLGLGYFRWQPAMCCNGQTPGCFNVEKVF